MTTRRAREENANAHGLPLCFTPLHYTSIGYKSDGARVKHPPFPRAFSRVFRYTSGAARFNRCSLSLASSARSDSCCERLSSHLRPITGPRFVCTPSRLETGRFTRRRLRRGPLDRGKSKGSAHFFVLALRRANRRASGARREKNARHLPDERDEKSALRDAREKTKIEPSANRRAARFFPSSRLSAHDNYNSSFPGSTFSRPQTLETRSAQL